MKRRFISMKIGNTWELVEVGKDYSPPLRTNTDAVLWNDRAYQDMGDTRFKSRVQHREYMRQHGLALADDFKGQWRSDEERRIKVRNGYDPTRQDDLMRAIHKLRKG